MQYTKSQNNLEWLFQIITIFGKNNHSSLLSLSRTSEPTSILTAIFFPLSKRMWLKVPLFSYFSFSMMKRAVGDLGWSGLYIFIYHQYALALFLKNKKMEKLKKKNTNIFLALKVSSDIPHTGGKKKSIWRKGITQTKHCQTVCCCAGSYLSIGESFTFFWSYQLPLYMNIT